MTRCTQSSLTYGYTHITRSGVALGFCGQSISVQLFLFTHKAWQMLRRAVSCHLSQLWPNCSFPLWIAKYGIFPRESTRWGVHMLLTNGQKSVWVMLPSYWQKGWCAPLPGCCSNGWSFCVSASSSSCYTQLRNLLFWLWRHRSIALRGGTPTKIH